VLYLLRKYLGEYVEGLSVEALRISVWKGIFLSYNNSVLFLLLNHNLLQSDSDYFILLYMFSILLWFDQAHSFLI
jgi:hypothetical protein